MLVQDLMRLMRAAQMFEGESDGGGAGGEGEGGNKPAAATDDNTAARLAEAEKRAADAQEKLDKINAERARAEEGRLRKDGKLEELLAKRDVESAKRDAALDLANEKLAAYEKKEAAREKALRDANKERIAALPEKHQAMAQKYSKTMGAEEHATFIAELEELDKSEAERDASAASTPGVRPPPRQPRPNSAEKVLEPLKRQALDIMLGKRNN